MASKISPLIRIFSQQLGGEDIETVRAEERLKRAKKRAIKEQKQASSRLLYVACVFAFFYVLIGAKMAVMAMSTPEKIEFSVPKAAFVQTRGEIIDRNGEILATNIFSNSLYTHPYKIVDADAAARGLVKIFPDLSYDKLLTDLRSDENFIWIKQQISPEQRQAVFDLGEPGLEFAPRENRLYPNGRVGAHILGGVKAENLGVEGVELVGTAGIEYQFDAQLANPELSEEPLQLTLDVAVQAALEDELLEGMRAKNSRRAAAVLMDVNSGEVIAMASMPDFDPNYRPKPKNTTDPTDDPLFDRAALGLYELGSTFKIFTAAAAIESGFANRNTMVKTGAPIKYGKYTINDFHSYGASLSLMDVIVKSSNIGTARIAAGMGVQKQKDFLRNLGFFEPTGLELPEAATARPILPKDWTELSTMTISYGHGLAATPLHLATAYSTMVNGGYKIDPTLIKSAASAHDNEKRTRVISATTSAEMREMLRAVVNRGTASFAQTDGYDIGGKTGTADKLRPDGGYYENKNTTTFAAAFPMSDPKYSLVVVMDEPSDVVNGVKVRTAGWTVVPVTKNIVERVAPLLGVRPEYDKDRPILAQVRE